MVGTEHHHISRLFAIESISVLHNGMCSSLEPFFPFASHRQHGFEECAMSTLGPVRTPSFLDMFLERTILVLHGHNHSTNMRMQHATGYSIKNAIGPTE